LKLTASDGKQRETDCPNIEGLFRITQSIPSPKAAHYKRWRGAAISSRASSNSGACAS
jgi:hypothetical protein